MQVMETSRICTVRRTIWTFCFLFLVSVCHARVELYTVPENNDSFSVEGWDLLQLKSSSTSGDFVWHSKWLALKKYLFGAELTECQESYDIFPCSTTLGGNTVLLIVYGYCLFKAAQFLSDGCELLLLVMHHGLLGGLLLPILGALPDALLILASGLSSSRRDAKAQVLVGMGLLSGTTIMLLTLLWGSSLIVGRCDLQTTDEGKKVAKDKTLTKGWSLTETGVTTDQQTRVSSWFMMITVIPYLVAQSPVMFGWSKTASRTTVLVGCILSFIGLPSYCTYQVLYPWIQKSWIYMAEEKLHRNTLGRLLDDNGTPNSEVLKKLFQRFDINGDGYLSVDEIRGFVSGLDFAESGLGKSDEDVLKAWMVELDVNTSGKVSEDEYVRGMRSWIERFSKNRNTGIRRQPTLSLTNEGPERDRPRCFMSDGIEEAETSYNALREDMNDDGVSDEPQGEIQPTKGQIIFRAVRYLVSGAVISGVIAAPLVGAVGNFSQISGVPPFFVSFVATSVVTSSSEAVTSLVFASGKTKQKILMTYSLIYGGVTMKNTVCLGIFLAVIYNRGLTWDFPSEVLAILIATMVIGILASVRLTFPLWMALIALALYPFSVALIAVLNHVYGWR